MRNLRPGFGKKHRHLLQTMALLLVIGTSLLLYGAAEAGSMPGICVLLGVLSAVMGFTLAVS